ncbi:hypothetical protein [Sphingobium yanoikuyae]|uniref:hypothetical protein n=1 Tax=Sphingobium yanoikuyae TaxID=13690 RepID=UPI0022DE1EE5|nr:hypothetical protein [Sphingobium yanoikuyae]WBQ18940.1 hypothetical protein PAE53_24075 [Sphingobium yanoikuyae]
MVGETVTQNEPYDSEKAIAPASRTAASAMSAGTMLRKFSTIDVFDAAGIVIPLLTADIWLHDARPSLDPNLRRHDGVARRHHAFVDRPLEAATV